MEGSGESVTQEGDSQSVSVQQLPRAGGSQRIGIKGHHVSTVVKICMAIKKIHVWL